MVLFVECYGHHRDLPSFPTRRSSDLAGGSAAADAWTAAKRAAGGRRRTARPCQVRPAGHVATDTFPRNALRSEEHTSELQSLTNLVCRLLLEKKNTQGKTLIDRQSAN